jgi:hypothetical protein
MTRSLSFSRSYDLARRDCATTICAKGGSRPAGSPDQSEQCVIWDGGHHSALGSFIFDLPSDRPETFAATAAAAISAECTFAQFVALSPYPGTVDFNRWAKTLGDNPSTVAGIPLTWRWLISQALRPQLYWDRPVMSAEEIRSRTQGVWDNFYGWGPIWKRSSFINSSRGRLAFVLISRIYRMMYADTGIATDSARFTWSGRWARWLAKPCRRLFAGSPVPELQVPGLRQPDFESPSLVPLSS